MQRPYLFGWSIGWLVLSGGERWKEAREAVVLVISYPEHHSSWKQTTLDFTFKIRTVPGAQWGSMPVTGCHCCVYFYGREKAKELPQIDTLCGWNKGGEGVKLCLMVYVVCF